MEGGIKVYSLIISEGQLSEVKATKSDTGENLTFPFPVAAILHRAPCCLATSWNVTEAQKKKKKMDGIIH
jgi:hypothetical protein